MTNQELMQEIKDLRKEQSEQHREMQSELKELKKEFYIFKGRTLGMVSVLTTFISLAIEFIKGK